MELIYKFLNKETTAEENDLLLEWVEFSPDNAKTFAEIKNLWTASQLQFSNEAIDLQQEFDATWNTIAKQEVKPVRSLQFLRHVMKYAAIIIIAVSITFFLFKQANFNKEINKESLFTQVCTGKGQKTQIALLDGTKVWLNSDSKLKYGSEYNQSDRIVYLDGEAFFDVAKNPKKPFLVKTAKISVRALGTSFNVRAFSTENTFATTLLTGSVSIENQYITDAGLRIAILKPNQRYTFLQNPNPSFTIEESKSLKAYTTWKENVLVIQSESLAEIALKLERWYDVRVHVLDESINKNIYSGTFQNKESILQVLKVMQQTTPIQFTIKENDIYIKKSSAKSVK